MRKLFLLSVLLLAALDVKGAYPSYFDFAPDQFYRQGNQVRLRTNAIPYLGVTNFNILNSKFTFNGIEITNIAQIESSGIVDTATIFVDVLGDDATGQRGNPGLPFLTLTGAVAVAQAGDTIRLGNGNFTNHVAVVLPSDVSLIGNGWNSTIIWSTNDFTMEGVALVPGTNSLLADFKIVNTLTNAIGHTIGRSTLAGQPAFQNATIRNVWSDAETGGYFNNGTSFIDLPCSVTIDGCRFTSHQQAFTWDGTLEDQIEARNSLFVSVGPSPLPGHDGVNAAVASYDGYAEMWFCSVFCTNFPTANIGIHQVTPGGTLALWSTWIKTDGDGVPDWQIVNTNGGTVKVYGLLRSNAVDGAVLQIPSLMTVDLDIVGTNSVVMTNGAVPGYVVTSDAFGRMSWQPASSGPWTDDGIVTYLDAGNTNAFRINNLTGELIFPGGNLSPSTNFSDFSFSATFDAGDSSLVDSYAEDTDATMSVVRTTNNLANAIYHRATTNESQGVRSEWIVGSFTMATLTSSPDGAVLTLGNTNGVGIAVGSTILNGTNGTLSLGTTNLIGDNGSGITWNGIPVGGPWTDDGTNTTLAGNVASFNDTNGNLTLGTVPGAFFGTPATSLSSMKDLAVDGVAFNQIEVSSQNDGTNIATARLFATESGVTYSSLILDAYPGDGSVYSTVYVTSDTNGSVIRFDANGTDSMLLTNGFGYFTGNLMLSGQPNLIGMSAGGQLTVDGVPVGGGSQTPWTSDIDAATFAVTNLTRVLVEDGTSQGNLFPFGFVLYDTNNTEIDLTIDESSSKPSLLVNHFGNLVSMIDPQGIDLSGRGRYLWSSTDDLSSGLHSTWSDNTNRTLMTLSGRLGGAQVSLADTNGLTNLIKVYASTNSGSAVLYTEGSPPTATVPIDESTGAYQFPNTVTTNLVIPLVATIRITNGLVMAVTGP